MPRTLQVDDIGPVDVAVILFEGNNFTGEVAPALLELQQTGIVHYIDLAFVSKGEDGSVVGIEIEDSPVSSAFAGLVDDNLDLLSADDLAEIGEGLDPNSSALVIVWANLWVTKLAKAIRGANGDVLFQERIPREVVEAALAALNNA